MVEFVGPRFSHFDGPGAPVGASHPQAWVQVAAVSRDQTRNTMTLFPSPMSDKLVETYGIKAGAELIRANGYSARPAHTRHSTMPRYGCW
ncbi:hypothetical protein [Streptomyces sp. NPDC002215]|uniref:hypothetical protein n=1 Tax=Streptomyces sp. NPDC002215 TaxID=3154412 RepID=UPI003316772C